jgi:hypothetical protein
VLAFWGTALIVPLLVIMGNAVIRWLFRLEPSHFADVILMFVVFDVLVISEHENVARYVQNATLKDGIIIIYATLLITNMFLWIVASFHIEQRLAAAYDNEIKRYVHLPWTDLAKSWGLSVLVFFANLASFAYKG